MTATVTFSIEVELGWGFHDIPVGDDLLTDDGKRERGTLNRLLDNLDETSIPFTFDVVGHLCLAACSGTHDGPHPAGWFESDPGSTGDRHPRYYAPEMVTEIKDRPTDHEVCTHTFSHSVRTDDRDELDWELDRVAELDPGQLSSFVAPRHSDTDYRTLADHGIEVIRVPAQHPGSTRARKLNTASRALPWQAPPIRDPSVVNDIVETYSSFEPSLTSPLLPNGARSAPLPFRFMPVGTRQRHQLRYLRRGVKRAIEHDSAVHYWTHLYNLANSEQFGPVVSFLEWLAEKRSETNVRIATMSELAGLVR
ncbi:polysaccharide deacetylase family protein [Halorientalis regularis]|uniref:Polysaccharide deacetylase n=1 Tax=Halorientalis regularis TaxID=660518 RepID=A0A1G7HGX2_9EURY|nr:polysaccharide deacetylase family protein [Halorientalis regularis]SDE99563.1 Polysaccharide deacetylase [Halorientalis regularis]